MKTHSRRILLLSMLSLMAAACQERVADHDLAVLRSDSAKLNAPAGFRPMSRGRSRNYKESPRQAPTVSVGRDLAELEGHAGDFFRNRKREAEAQRKAQRWLQPADLDLGDRRDGAIAKGKFTLANPTNKSVMIKTFMSSCACQKLILHLDGKVYEVKKGNFKPILLPAGAKGELEVHIEAKQGLRTTSVTMLTTDAKEPNILVYARVNGVKDFILTVDGKSQSSIYLGTLTRKSTKSFEIVVHARDKKAFQILRHQDLPPKMQISYAVDPKDPSVWHIKGKLGPDLEPGSHEGGHIIFETDRGAGLEFSVHSLVLDPIEIEPRGMISFGLIPKEKGDRTELKVRINEPGASFGIASVIVLDCKLSGAKLSSKLFGITINMAPDGRSGTLTLSVPPGLKRGRLFGKLKISFKQQDLPPRVIRFAGIVR